MGDGNEVCVLHGDLSREISMLNKDLGKVSERVGRVEENTKCLPDMQKDIKEIKEQKIKTLGFIAGVSFTVSAIFSFATWLIAKVLHS